MDQQGIIGSKEYGKQGSVNSKECRNQCIIDGKEYGRNLISCLDEFGDSGDGNGKLKEVYNSIKDSPNYPEGFQSRQNGTTSNKVNNTRSL